MTNTTLTGLSLAAALSANAATATYTVFDNTGVTPTTNWTDTFTIPQFDAVGLDATLVSVQYTLTANVLGTARAESLDAGSASITLNISATVTVSGPSLASLVSIPTGSQLFAATAFDGSIDFGGASGATFPGLTGSDSDSGTLTGGSLLPYLGVGNVAGSIGANGTSSGSGAGNLITQFATAAGAKLEITYTYNQNEVPEASTWAAIGFVAFVGGSTFLRRRNR
jgi:hypothetical protein